jgi:hypothetical protein
MLLLSRPVSRRSIIEPTNSGSMEWIGKTNGILGWPPDKAAQGASPRRKRLIREEAIHVGRLYVPFDACFSSMITPLLVADSATARERTALFCVACVVVLASNARCDAVSFSASEAVVLEVEVVSVYVVVDHDDVQLPVRDTWNSEAAHI